MVLPELLPLVILLGARAQNFDCDGWVRYGVRVCWIELQLVANDGRVRALVVGRGLALGVQGVTIGAVGAWLLSAIRRKPFVFELRDLWPASIVTVGAMQDSPNLELAKEFIRFATLDQENLTNWATGVYTNESLKAIDPNVPADQAQAPGDFVSSQVVVEKIIPSFDDSELSAFLAGQNSYAGFAEAAPSVNAKLMTGSDDAIQRALNDPINQYLNGVVDIDTMWSTWKDALRIEFPDLIIN